MTTPKPGAETLPLQSRVSVIALERFGLSVVEGPDEGKSVTAERDEIAVGTAEGNDLRLTDKSVSRHHFTITSTPRGFVLRDLDSSNGTVIGGCRMLHGYLDDVVTIGLGRTKLRFEPTGEAMVAPLSEAERFGSALGVSPAMRRLFAVLPRVAASESTVLLEGETGTGKGVLARALHQASPRASGPMVVLDCGAIPASLIESELFGHVRGAFTGATADRAGAFEQAAGGTIFLDEIGELPLDMQPKLLRALEERTVKRVGGGTVTLDVRVVAATNRDLREEVNRGSFRADLYYRLNIIRLVVPPLRERREDIPLLVAHFYAQLAPGQTPPAALVAELQRHAWAGNVRELRAAVERAILLGSLGSMATAALEAPPVAAPSAPAEVPFDPDVSFRDAKEEAIGAWEHTYLAQLIEHTGGNLSQAARVANMDRSYLRELLRKHELGGHR